MAGWIKLHRQFTDWEWYSDPVTRAVFLHLLLTVEYKKTKWKGIELEPGQGIIGRKKIADELQLSERQVRTALNRLKSTSNLTIKTTNKFSVVTIENWAKYQGTVDENDQQNDQQSDQQTTNKRPQSKKERIYNNNNIYNPPLFFPPTVEEVRVFCQSRGNNVDPQRFVSYYESKGWMVGKNKMKNWKQAVITWERQTKGGVNANGRKDSNPTGKVEKPKESDYDYDKFFTDG